MDTSLKYVLESEANRFSPAFQKAARDADALEQTIFKLQGTTLTYNTVLGEFRDAQGGIVNSFSGLNALGVRTTAQITRQIKVYDQLIERFQADKLVTQQLILQKQQLARQYGLLDQATGLSGKKLRLNTQIYFQAGQAISDFAIAGVRGAANNIEFLAAQLGASGPLLIGLSLASAAFFVFGDDILRALNPVGEKVKDLKKGFEELVEFASGVEIDRSLVFFDEDLPTAIEFSQAALKELRAELGRLNTQTTGGVTTFSTGGERGAELRQEIAEIQALLDTFEKRQDEINSEQETFQAGLNNAILEANRARGEEIKQRITALGLAEELGDTTNAELVTLQKRGELEEFIAGLEEERKRSARENLTFLERQEEKLRELRKTLERFGTLEGDRLRSIREQTELLNAQIKSNELQEKLEFASTQEALRLAFINAQNEQLSSQIKLLDEINAARANPQTFTGSGLQSQEDAGITNAGIRDQTFLERIGAREDERSNFERDAFEDIPNRLRVLPPGVEAEFEQFNDMADGTNRILLNMSDILSGNLAAGFTEFAFALGDGANVLEALGDTLRAGVGGLLIDLGRAAIAEGTLGLAMQAFRLNPGGAILAGIAAVAIGQRLQRRAQERSDAFFGGGGSSSSSFQSFASNTQRNEQRRAALERGTFPSVTPDQSPQAGPGQFVPTGARAADGQMSVKVEVDPIQLIPVEVANGVIFRAAQKGSLQNVKLGRSGDINKGSL